MSASFIKNTCLAAVVMAGLTTAVHAQLDDPCSPFYGCPNDMQYFDPVDLDLDCRGCCGPCGFYFRYDKLGMVTTGERAMVGDPDTVQLAFQPLGGVPLDPETGQPLERPIILNSIRSAIPRAVWNTADRYELGYWAENNAGWMMAVLNGPNNQQIFNIGVDDFPLDDDGNPPVIDPLAAENVFVSFRSAPGSFAGWLDIDEGGINGIGAGDGFADDINFNGQYGAQGIDTDADGVPDTFLAIPPDYGDLVTLTTGYAQVNLRNKLRINGFEMMRAYRLDNGHYQVKHQNNHLEWGVGARFLQLDDTFIFNGVDGLFIGDGHWKTSIVNNIVGPQLSFKWNHTRGRWTLQSQGNFMFGYNVRDWSQRGFVLAGKVPGSVNAPLIIRGKSFSYGRNDDDFSPVGELKLNLKYRLTDNVYFNLGYTGTFADNIRRASTHVDYVLYDEAGRVMGFRDGGRENIFASAVNVGVEVTQ